MKAFLVPLALGLTLSGCQGSQGYAVRSAMTSPQNPKRAEILALLEGHTDRAEEARILALLRDTSATELDALLLSLPLDRLFSAIDDRIVGPNNRAALLKLL